jgi:hypothetical protein
VAALLVETDNTTKADNSSIEVVFIGACSQSLILLDLSHCGASGRTLVGESLGSLSRHLDRSGRSLPRPAMHHLLVMRRCAVDHRRMMIGCSCERENSRSNRQEIHLSSPLASWAHFFVVRGGRKVLLEPMNGVHTKAVRASFRSTILVHPSGIQRYGLDVERQQAPSGRVAPSPLRRVADSASIADNGSHSHRGEI